jgi:hypothetical protein
MGVLDELGIKDNEDAMVRLLVQIAKNTGGLDGGDTSITQEGDQTTVTREGDTISQDETVNVETAEQRTGMIAPRAYVVKETADLDGANPDGTITVDPSKEVVVAEWEPGQDFSLLAAGATDHPNAAYLLRADSNSPIGGATASPLGSVTDPFSFVDELGGAVYCEKRVQYLVRLSSNATESIDVAARLHGEVMA